MACGSFSGCWLRSRKKARKSKGAPANSRNVEGSGGPPQLPVGPTSEASDLARNDGSSGLAAPHLPGPEQTKAGTMPGYDRFWLNNGQRRAPVTPEVGQTDPQQAVPGGQFRAFSCEPLKHADLVAQSQVLERKGSTRTEDRGQSCEECHERNVHRREL
jgi:hypothetical protein